MTVRLSPFLKLYLFFSFIILSPQLVAGPTDNSGHFDRFFTTYQERVVLDAYRENGPEEFVEAKFSDTITPIKKTGQFHLKGVVLRKDGRHVVWINNENTLDNTEIDEGLIVDIRRIKNKGPKVPLQYSKKEFLLKPGQIWFENEEVIIESYVNNDEDDVKDKKEESKENQEDETGGLNKIINTFDKQRRQAEIDSIMDQGK